MTGLNPVTRTPFVGRQPEVMALTTCLEVAQSGQAGIVLVAGEPGIGKTRLLLEIGSRALDTGWEVLTGRAYDTEGIPPYLPFLEALRAYVRACSADALQAQLGDGAADVALIVPDINRCLPGLRPSTPLSSDHERYRLFESVADFLLAAASSSRGLLLCLDDLHWTDGPTLLLLQHLARRIVPGRAPFLMIGAYRTEELSRDHPLLDVLANLTRERLAERLLLGPFSRSDAAALVSGMIGVPVTPTLLDAIHRTTEGNPFFIEEIVRHLAETAQFSVEHGVRALDTAKLEPVGVPEGVRQVIGRRLSRLSPEANRMLQVAAVLGDGFGFADIIVAEIEEAQLLDAVEEALRAGILREEGNAYHFTHALIRQTINDGMTLPRRQRLHLRVAEAIEGAHVADSGGRAAKQAVHYRLAGTLADREKTIALCLRAGQGAAAVFAWEESVDHWRAALELMKPTDHRRRCKLLVKLGEVQRRAGDLHQAMATFRQAAAEARRLADPRLLAHAALGFEDALLPSGLPRAGVGDTSILLLEEAFGALAEADGPLRARVLAALARALYFAGVRDRSTALSEQAVALARRAGDPAALAYALAVLRISIWGPDHAAERLAVADELIRLADATGDLELALAGHQWRLSAVFELGDMPAVINEIETHAQLAEAVRQPQALSDVFAWRATLALMDGQVEEAERLTHEALAIGQRAQSQNAVVDFTVQMVVLRREQWRLDDLRGLESVIRSYAEQFPLVPSWRPMLALIACDLGDHAGAWRILDAIAVNDFTDIPRNLWLWLPIVTMLSETCVVLGDTPRAATLYELLLPYADRNVSANTAIACFGSVSYFLGRLATVMSRWEDAARHFGDALVMNERMGLKPWVAHTLRAYAHLLISRPHRAAADLARAREMLEQAVAIYTDTNVERGRIQAMALLADRRLAADRRRPRAHPDRLTEREVEVLRLVAAGGSNREIADRLFLSVRTVERHIGNVYSKTGVHDRRSARVYALRHGLIDVAEHGPT